ncbi:MAG: hypothetical protein ACRC3B_13400, partial [Bacteroidia bacterium]
MSYNLFAHEEDDENHYGFRKDPRKEAAQKHLEHEQEQADYFIFLLWPQIQRKMQSGKKITSSDVIYARLYGTPAQRKETQAYWNGFGGGGKDGTLTDDEKNKANASADSTLPAADSTLPVTVSGNADNLSLTTATEPEKKQEKEPEKLTYTIEVTEDDSLLKERNSIDISTELTQTQKDIFKWSTAVSIMRDVNKPGTKNYSEDEFRTFVRRSFKEGWLPGKTPVPNARNPRIIGWRGHAPIIEALNYDEAFLFARTHQPPFQKFDAYYII